jgi:hypothetical protein
MLATGPTNVRILPCSFTHACNLSKHFIFVTTTNAITGNAGKSQQKQCNPGWCWPHRQLAPRSDAQRRPTVSSAACGSPAYNTLRITHSRSLSSSLSPAVAYITHTAIACICRGHRDWHCQCLTCPCCCQHCIHMLLHADHSLNTLRITHALSLPSSLSPAAAYITLPWHASVAVITSGIGNASCPCFTMSMLTMSLPCTAKIAHAYHAHAYHVHAYHVTVLCCHQLPLTWHCHGHAHLSLWQRRRSQTLRSVSKEKGTRSCSNETT